MKWKTIKDRCINIASKELDSVSKEANWTILLARLIKEDNGMTFYNAQKITKEKCYKIIDNWDIRQWQSLKNRFPKAFPSGFQQPELTEDGWELI